MGAKITLSDGRVVNVTSAKMTVREFRAFVSPGGGPEEDDAMVSKYTGISVDDLQDLTQTDYRTLVFAIVREANRHDPNSASVSISQP